jgi:hypothetical protein
LTPFSLKTVLLVASLLFLSCGKEKITPVYGVKKIGDQIADLNLQVSTGMVQVGGQFDSIGNIQARPIGQVVRRLAEILADIEIQRGQVGQMKLGPYQYTINEIDSVSFEYIKDIVIKRLKLQLGSPRAKETKKDTGGTLVVEEQDFSFIKNLEIYIRFEDELTGPAPIPTTSVGQTQTSEKTQGPAKSDSIDGTGPDNSSTGPSDELFKDAFLAFSYQKGVQPLACGGKCIELYPHGLNWKKRLQENRTFTVLVKLDVAKAPKEEFDFEGIIDFSVSLKLDL